MLFILIINSRVVSLNRLSAGCVTTPRRVERSLVTEEQFPMMPAYENQLIFKIATILTEYLKSHDFLSLN